MKKFHLAIVIVLSVFICAGIGIFIWVLLANRDFVQDVELEANNTTTKELSFTAVNFNPGDTHEYAVSVHCGETGDFAVTFSSENVGEGELWKYLDIEIVCGEDAKSLPLAKLIEGEKLSFDISLTEDVPMCFTIRYSMSIDVGNEASKTSTDLALTLTAERM